MQPDIISFEELNLLPPLAIVAFAARCCARGRSLSDGKPSPLTGESEASISSSLADVTRFAAEPYIHNQRRHFIDSATSCFSMGDRFNSSAFHADVSSHAGRAMGCALQRVAAVCYAVGHAVRTACHTDRAINHIHSSRWVSGQEIDLLWFKVSGRDFGNGERDIAVALAKATVHAVSIAAMMVANDNGHAVRTAMKRDLELLVSTFSKWHWSNYLEHHVMQDCFGAF